MNYIPYIHTNIRLKKSNMGLVLTCLTNLCSYKKKPGGVVFYDTSA